MNVQFGQQLSIIYPLTNLPFFYVSITSTEKYVLFRAQPPSDMLLLAIELLDTIIEEQLSGFVRLTDLHVSYNQGQKFVDKRQNLRESTISYVYGKC